MTETKPESSITVLITNDRFGIGDARLGEILMKSFLNTLWDSRPRPQRIILMNSGVQLAVEGSDVLDALNLLVKDGVTVLSCGTCLDYYNLRDKLKVGQVTKMPDTVQSLLTADKIIKI